MLWLYFYQDNPDNRRQFGNDVKTFDYDVLPATDIDITILLPTPQCGVLHLESIIIYKSLNHDSHFVVGFLDEWSNVINVTCAMPLPKIKAGKMESTRIIPRMNRDKNESSPQC